MNALRVHGKTGRIWMRFSPSERIGGKLSAGLLKREYFKSHNLGIADCLIAATAISSNAKLKTLNVKHFPMFKNLEVADSKG